MSNLYLLFAGPTFYPGGGTEDLLATFTADDDAAALDRTLHTTTGHGHEWIELARIDGTAVTTILDTRKKGQA